jgi:threonine dehydratase
MEGFLVSVTNLKEGLENSAKDIIGLEDVLEAQKAIAPHIRRTQTMHNRTLSERLGTHLYLKMEVFQKTGAFKVRGAFNKMLTLNAEDRRRGVVAVSGGNHAQAVAYAARELGMKAVILMPENTPTNYLQATRGYGASIVLTVTMAEAFKAVSRYIAEGWTYVHPFDDPLVIAGQGTIGLEILKDVPEATDVVISIGGGGLIGGVATAIKTLKPEVRIWGVETLGADSMSQALLAGRVVQLPAITSIAHTLGAPAVTERTLRLTQRYVEKVVVVTDEEALEAARILLVRAKVLTEAAASCTLAAAQRLCDQFSPQNHVVLVLCGGNMSIDDLCRCRVPVARDLILVPPSGDDRSCRTTENML